MLIRKFVSHLRRQHEIRDLAHSAAAGRDSKPLAKAEQFLEWAEENPDELIAIQQAEADRALKELLREQRELDRTVRSAKRYKQSPEVLARLLAGVPF
jgi:hypothetical protein